MRHGWIRGDDLADRELSGVVAGSSISESWSETSSSASEESIYSKNDDARAQL